MKNLTIFSLFALAAIAMANLSAPTCTSQLRTVMIPIAHITQDLELQSLEQLSIHYQTFLNAVEGINAICEQPIQKLMFQMRLEGLTCESKLGDVLAKAREFENLEVATDNDITRISTFLLSHIPTLQTVCVSQQALQEEVPVAEPAQPEVQTPVTDSIENPISYQGFEDFTAPEATEEATVETEEVAPQQEAAPVQEASQDPYELTQEELAVIANILSHIPNGNAQAQPKEETPVEEPVAAAQQEATSPKMGELAQGELALLAGILGNSNVNSQPEPKEETPVEEEGTLSSRIALRQPVKNSKVGSTESAAPAETEGQANSRVFLRQPVKNSTVESTESAAPSAAPAETEAPETRSRVFFRQPVKKSATLPAELQENAPTVQKLIDAVSSQEEATPEPESVEATPENPEETAERIQELIDAITTEEEATPEPVTAEPEVEATPENTEETAEIIQELIDAVTSEEETASEPEPVEAAPEVEEEAAPKLSDIYTKLLGAVREEQAGSENAEAQPQETQAEAPETTGSRIALRQPVKNSRVGSTESAAPAPAAAEGEATTRVVRRQPLKNSTVESTESAAPSAAPAAAPAEAEGDASRVFLRQPVKNSTVGSTESGLPVRSGVETGSRIARRQPLITKPEATATATEENKASDDPRPECLAVVYQSFSVLYMFSADAVAQDVKSLESDYKSLEKITDGINSFCIPTITRDETFSGADSCDDELRTMNDIIKKFKKNGPTDYLNVIDTIQNLWSLHKAFENDCIKKSDNQTTQIEEVAAEAVAAEPETPAVEAVEVPEDKCQTHYVDMTEKLVKMSYDAIEENLSEILSDLNDIKKTIFGINRYCELRYRVDVFPRGAMEAQTCEQDFVELRNTFASSTINEMEDLAKVTQNAWNLGLRLLHDC